MSELNLGTYAENTWCKGCGNFGILSAIGAAVVLGSKEHIAITYFIDKLPASARRIVDIINYILIAFLNGVIIWYGMKWINITGSYLTAVLKIHQVYGQFVVPVGCSIAILYCFYHIVLIINPEAAKNP